MIIVARILFSLLILLWTSVDNPHVLDKPLIHRPHDYLNSA
jgi:hypothetical protein